MSYPVKIEFFATSTLKTGGSTVAVPQKECVDNKYTVIYSYVIPSGCRGLTVGIYVNGIRKASNSYGNRSNSTVAGKVDVIVDSETQKPTIMISIGGTGILPDVLLDHNFIDDVYYQYTPTDMMVPPDTPTLLQFYPDPKTPTTMILRGSGYHHVYDAPLVNREFNIVDTDSGAVLGNINAVTISTEVAGATYRHSYTAKIRDTCIGNKVSAWSDVKVAVSKSIPDEPTVTTGAITATSVVLNGSAFSDAGGFTHASSSWVLTRVYAGGTKIVEYSGGWDTTNKTTITIPDLTPLADYEATLRYMNSVDVASPVSAPTSFSTAEASSKVSKIGVRILGLRSATSILSVIITRWASIKASIIGVMLGMSVLMTGKIGAHIGSDVTEDEGSISSTDYWEDAL